MASEARSNTVHVRALRSLIVLSVYEGKIEEARRHVAALRERDASQTISSIRQASYHDVDRANVERYLNAFREAGLPE